MDGWGLWSKRKPLAKQMSGGSDLCPPRAKEKKGSSARNSSRQKYREKARRGQGEWKEQGERRRENDRLQMSSFARRRVEAEQSAR
eukprot:1418675-Pleurochrysis_carterae.AAC.1